MQAGTLLRLLRLGRLGRRFLPWVSLASGVAGALLMDRGPRGAVGVAIAAVVVWVLLLVLVLLRRAAEQGRLRKRWFARLQLSSVFVTQSSIQLALFFALPFFGRAWAGTIEQLAFLVLVGAAAVVSLWDPWTERCLTQPSLAPLLPALASFVGLVVVLPGLGLSNTAALWTAAAATAMALPLGLVAGAARGDGRRWTHLAVTLATGLAFPLVLVLGAARFVPPAPLSLTKVQLGTMREGREVVDPTERLEHRPEMLVCATAIAAPLGVRETLYHVWRHDGIVRDRIALTIKGGNERGFRTFSHKRRLGAHPQGRWTCTVETELGQSLGGGTITLAW